MPVRAYLDKVAVVTDQVKAAMRERQVTTELLVNIHQREGCVDHAELQLVVRERIACQCWRCIHLRRSTTRQGLLQVLPAISYNDHA